MSVGAIDELARVLEDAYGMSSDAAKRLARAIDDSNIANNFAIRAADQPARVTEEAGGAISRSALFIGGGGAAIGGGIAADQYLQLQEVEEVAQNREEQRAFLEQVLSNPNLDPERKGQLLETALDRGLFSQLGGGGDGGGVFSDIFGGIAGGGLTKTILLLIVVWFGGKAVVSAVGDGGGS